MLRIHIEDEDLCCKYIHWIEIYVINTYGVGLCAEINNIGWEFVCCKYTCMVTICIMKSEIY